MEIMFEEFEKNIDKYLEMVGNGESVIVIYKDKKIIFSPVDKPVLDKEKNTEVEWWKLQQPNSRSIWANL